MKSTKAIKVISIVMTVLVILMVGLSFSQTVFAITPGSISPTDPASTSEITDIAGRILGFLQVVAVALLVVMIAVLGIKYMMGSAEEKADYKKSFVPLVVGALLVFAAVTVANFIYSVMQ
jgi:type IV secretory pathway VirB2 component (pilin)